MLLCAGLSIKRNSRPVSPDRLPPKPPKGNPHATFVRTKQRIAAPVVAPVDMA
jgi:hypothetical protein